MRIQGSGLREFARTLYPEVDSILGKARALTPRGRREIIDYQAMLLYCLAKDYDFEGANFLEIGTFWGFSAAMMAMAAPRANIVTLNPKPWEYEKAVENLRPLGNVRVFCVHSWDYLENYPGPKLDMIFVDGDHKRIEKDLPWWDWVKEGGLFLHHDYSPQESARPCQVVYERLNRFCEEIGQDFDVLVVDDEGVGMAGWRKTDGKR